MSASKAYEEMLKSGQAFKKIDMKKIGRQLNAEATRGASINERNVENELLGEEVPTNSKLEDDDTDWSDVDEGMQRRINSLKSKINDHKKKTFIKENTEIEKLKKRVATLEEALMLVMKTHEELLG